MLSSQKSSNRVKSYSFILQFQSILACSLENWNLNVNFMPAINNQYSQSVINHCDRRITPLSDTGISFSSSSSSVYRVYSSLSVILQRDSQDKSPAGQYLQLKTGGNLIYTVRNWAGDRLPSVSLNSSTELAVVAADGRLFQSRMDLGKKEFR